jgi:hypothetical protein
MIALFQCDSCHAIDEETSEGQRYCKFCLERQRKYAEKHRGKA